MIRTHNWLQGNFKGVVPNEHINPNSIDLTLGPDITEWRIRYSAPHNSANKAMLDKMAMQGYELDEDYQWLDEYKEYGIFEDETFFVFKKEYKNLPIGQAFAFMPRRFYLVHSAEFIKTLKGHVATPYLKSSLARLGMVHPVTIGDCGFDGQWQFEFSPTLPVRIRIGARIMQLVFFCADEHPECDYRTKGRYQSQTGVTESKGLDYV